MDRYDAAKGKWSYDNGDLDDFSDWKMIFKILGWVVGTLAVLGWVVSGLL